MPIGSISMSDGKAGSIPPSDKKIPEALVQPFDGGLAFKDSAIPTTRFSHHPSTGTCRADLRLPDRDAAAAYDSDHTVELASVVPAPDVGFRTTHVDQYGITRAGKHHERRRVDAPWAFTGDRTRLAEAGMDGVRVHTETFGNGTKKKWAGPEVSADGIGAGGLKIHLKDPYASAAGSYRSQPMDAPGLNASNRYTTPYRPGESAAAPGWAK